MSTFIVQPSTHNQSLIAHLPTSNPSSPICSICSCPSAPHVASGPHATSDIVIVPQEGPSCHSLPHIPIRPCSFTSPYTYIYPHTDRILVIHFPIYLHLSFTSPCTYIYPHTYRILVIHSVGEEARIVRVPNIVYGTV